MEHPIFEVITSRFYEDIVREIRLDMDHPDIEDLLTRWFFSQLANTSFDEDLREYLRSHDISNDDIEELNQVLANLSKDRIGHLRRLEEYVRMYEYSIIVTHREDTTTRLKIQVDPSIPIDVPKKFKETIDDALESQDMEISIPTEAYDNLTDHCSDDALIFVVAKRYSTMGEMKYQERLPKSLLELFQRELGVCHEALISPIDSCPYMNYTSAYPDIDGRFGSLGHYRTLHDIVRGSKSILVNLPPVEFVINNMSRHIDELLSEENGDDITFVVVLSWSKRNTEGYLRLKRSSYLTYRLHPYKSWTNKTAPLDSSYMTYEIERFPRNRSDCCIFVLQNKGWTHSIPELFTTQVWQALR